MSGYTHAAVGANAVWLAVAVGGVDERVAILVAAGAIAGLLPDVDAARAKIHYMFGSVLLPFQGSYRGVFAHRGIFHSVLAVFIIFIISLFFLRQFHPLLPVVVALAYASHPIIDSFNFSGVRFFSPFSARKINLLPRVLRTRVGGPIDQGLFALSMMSLLFFFILNLGVFLEPFTF